MKFDQRIAGKAIPVAAAVSVLAATGGCATDSEDTYSPELGPATPPAAESAPALPDPTTPDTPAPTQDMDCFLTTACVRGLGLPDDCHELAVLRRFRDQYLMRSAVGRAEVLRYYRIAPQIVLALRKTPAPEAEHLALYRSLVQPAVKLIEAGRFEKAFAHYRKTILALAEKFNVDIA